MQLGRDKLDHLVLGYVVASWFFLLGCGPIITLAAAVTVGGAKEIYDKVSGKGHPEWLDFIATALGGTPFLLSMVL